MIGWIISIDIGFFINIKNPKKLGIRGISSTLFIRASSSIF